MTPTHHDLPTRTVRLHAGTPHAGAPQSPPAPASPGRVLVVDDDLLVREIVSETLIEAGFETATTRDPEKARQLLERHAPGHFECVVTDYLMPGSNGIEFARAVLERDPSLRVLMLTSQDDKEVVKASLRGGIFDFLEKPVKAPALLEAVIRAVQDTRRLRQGRPARYVPEESAPIGEGGMGAVFRARDTELNRTVALKRLRQAEGRGTEALLREALTLASLSHPNVVQVFDCGSDAQGPYIVMELLQGRSLDRFINSSPPLDGPLIAALAIQCLQGLAAAHTHGVLHRDIKPSNIMVLDLPGGGLHIKLLDFGLAGLAHPPAAPVPEDSGSITGSIHTMAPEQLRQEPVGPRTDLYALGCVVYFMAARVMPFRGATLAEIFHNHLEHCFEDLARHRPDLSPSLRTAIMRLMAFDPAHRPADAADAIRLFTQV